MHLIIYVIFNNSIEYTDEVSLLIKIMNSSYTNNFYMKISLSKNFYL